MCSTPYPVMSQLSEQTFSSLLATQIEQQREMFTFHQELTAAMRLPQPKIPLYKGDVTEYKSFIMAFDSRIRSKTADPADLLYYLHQHLSDGPRDLIEGCLHLPSEEGYHEARRLLDKEYGDPYKVSVAYTTQLQKWPPIKNDNAIALKTLSMFLIKCTNAMKSISYMDVLDHTPHMQTIVQKLPPFLQSKWRERVLCIRQQSKRHVKFSDLVQFVEHAAETSNDPVYSKEALGQLGKQEVTRSLATSTLYADSGGGSSPDVSRSPQGAGSSHTTGSTQSVETSATRENTLLKCPLCDESHDLEECKEFMNKTLTERKKFIAEKGLCFACFGTDHRSKGCVNRRTCSKCNKAHPTTLHLENFTTNDRGDNRQSTPNTVSSTCTDIGKSQQSSTVVFRAIIPVKVASRDGTPVTTYALYDNGSSGSFITESLKEDLKVKGIDTTLRLGTMHGQSSVKSSVIENLTACDLQGNNPVQLDRCYSRHEIPVSHEQIPTPDLIHRLDNLRVLKDCIPDLMPHVEIGLLIGSDCPAALEPLEVLPSRGTGPFATRLRHGWTVNGPVQLSLNQPHVCYSNNIMVKEPSLG